MAAKIEVTIHYREGKFEVAFPKDIWTTKIGAALCAYTDVDMKEADGKVTCIFETFPEAFKFYKDVKKEEHERLSMLLGLALRGRRK